MVQSSPAPLTLAPLIPVILFPSPLRELADIIPITVRLPVIIELPVTVKPFLMLAKLFIVKFIPAVTSPAVCKLAEEETEPVTVTFDPKEPPPDICNPEPFILPELERLPFKTRAVAVISPVFTLTEEERIVYC